MEFDKIMEVMNYNFDRPNDTPSNLYQTYMNFTLTNQEIFTPEQRKEAEIGLLSSRAIGDGVERPGYEEAMSLLKEMNKEKSFERGM
jgi:hypothetical protein